VNIKSFDWRVLKKYLGPQAINDLNDFLERLPQMAGQSALIAGGIAWLSAAAIGLYTTVQTQSLIEMRAELQETEALRPNVPTLRNIPVNQKEVARFVNNLKSSYPNLNISQKGPIISVEAKSTAQFGVFREAVGHVQNGGSGWRVSVDQLCVGRECSKNALTASLRIGKVSVDMPG